MSDIFISYKHKDLNFLKRLHDALTADKRSVWVDWKGIPPSDEFQKAIDAAIASAHACVFVLSPEHIDSEYCQLELQQALKNNKRMIPVVYRDVDEDQVHDALAKKNFIWMREQDDFSVGMEKLREALDTDLEWVHEHTRLLTRALDWDSRKRHDSLVLQGEDLNRAETWLTQAGAAKRLRPTQLQTEFIQYSRRIANRRYRFFVMRVTVAVCLMAIFGVVSLWESKLARLRESGVRAARAGMFSERAIAALAEADASSAEVYCAQALEAEDGQETRERLIEETRERLVQARSRTAPLTWPPPGSQPISYQKGSRNVAPLPVTLQSGSLGLNASALQFGGKLFAVCCPPVEGRQSLASFAPRWQDGAIWIGNVTGPDPVFRLQNSAPLSHPTPDAWGGAARLVFCPENSLLAASDKMGHVRVWRFDIQNGASQVCASLPAGHSRTQCLAFSYDGRWLAQGDADGKIRLWNAQTGQYAQTLAGHTDTISALAFSPDGQRLASGDWDHMVKVWKARPPSGAASPSSPSPGFASLPLYTLRRHEDLIESLVFSDGGGKLASGSDDNTICVWNLQQYDNERSGGSDKSEPAEALRGHQNSIISLAFSRGGRAPGRWLVSGSVDNTVRVWDLEKGEANLTLRGHQSDVSGVAFTMGQRSSPYGQYLPDIGVISLSARGARRCWNLSLAGQRDELMTLTTPPMRRSGSAFSSVAFNPLIPGQVAAGGWDHAVRFWDGRDPIPTRILPHSEDILSVAYSPDGQMLAYGCRAPNSSAALTPASASLQLRASHDLKTLMTLPLPVPPAGTPLFTAATVRSVTFSPDGRLAACSDAGTLLVWKTEEGGRLLAHPSLCGSYQVPKLEQEEAAKALCVAFSRDGRYIAVGSGSGRLYLADTREGEAKAPGETRVQPLKQLYPSGAEPGEGEDSDIWGAAFSPDGSQVIFANERGRVLACDARTGQSLPLATPPHHGAVWSLACSPDGRWIATAGQDSTVRLWDTRSQKSHVLRASRRPVWSVTFSPDGKRLASCGLEGKVRIWNLDALDALFTAGGGDLRKQAEQRTGLHWDETRRELIP